VTLTHMEPLVSASRGHRTPYAYACLNRPPTDTPLALASHQSSDSHGFFVVLQLVDRASSALALGVAHVNAVLGRRLRIGGAWASERCGIEDTLSCASSAVDRPARRVRFLGGTR
jgi:hypothetical protein